MSGFEYRVRWRREGRRWAPPAFFQTREGAERKAARLRALDDALYHDGDGAGLISDDLIESHANHPDPLPELAELVVEKREVGPWRAS